MINGDEVRDASEMSDFASFDECLDAKIFSCDVSFGINEANRSTEETNVHNLLDLFVVSLAVEWIVGENTLLVFSSISGVISLSLILLLCRNAGRLLGQFGALNIGV